MSERKDSFGKQYAELEKIVAEFEDGKLDLEESLAKFEIALKLAQGLQKRLTEVENKITTIKNNFKDVLEN